MPSGGATTTSTATSTTSTTPSSKGATKQKSDVPKLGHIFEIMLSAPSYKAAFGHTSTLSALRSLIHKGTLLSGYKTLGDGELADELAAVSGQAPNHDTKLGCTSYVDFPTAAVANKAGLVPGRGCVYPDTALTIGDQVTASGATWGAYVADMGKETCVHPNSGAVDNVLPTGAEPGYDTRHNPFIYFHSLLDLGDCSSDDVDLSKLPKALAHPAKTPAFAYVAPNACADGDPDDGRHDHDHDHDDSDHHDDGDDAFDDRHDQHDAQHHARRREHDDDRDHAGRGDDDAGHEDDARDGDDAGRVPGRKPVRPRRRERVPEDVGSEDPALGRLQARRLLVIAFTRSGAATGHPARAGALILSPDARRGATVASSQTPYSLLRFDEDALGLSSPLAHAKAAKGLAAAVLTAKQG